MAHKKKIKKSEAKIIIYINQVDSINKSVGMISLKLKMDLAFLSKVLAQMHFKQWIKKLRRHNKTFIELAHKCPDMEEVQEAMVMV